MDTSTVLAMISEHLKTIDQNVKNLTSQVDKLANAPTWYQKTLSPVMKRFVDTNPVIGSLSFSAFLLHESSELAEKSLNAVLEKVPDTPNRAYGKEKLPSDGEMITMTCQRAGIAPPVDFWRQPSKNPKSPRVIKVRFSTEKERNDFLRDFRKNYQGPGRAPYARRDLTVPELQLMYQLRREVYNANAECGFCRYYVHHDLTVKASTNPRPFVQYQKFSF